MTEGGKQPSLTAVALGFASLPPFGRRRFTVFSANFALWVSRIFIRIRIGKRTL